MANATVELSKEQVVNALSQLPVEDIKSIIDELFSKKLFQPPTLAELRKECGEIVKKNNIDISVVDEAVKWARSKK